MRHHCVDCKRDEVPLRMDMQDTASGPAMRPVCETCYAKDCAARKAEGKRQRYRPRIVPWSKLEPVAAGTIS